MSKVVGASCQSYASEALGCEAGLSGEKGSKGHLAQLAYMVGRGCEGRKLHFALGHISMLEYLKNCMVVSILLVCMREKNDQMFR